MTAGDPVHIVAGIHAGKLARVERAFNTVVRVRINSELVGRGAKVVRLKPHEVEPLSVIFQLAALAGRSTKHRVRGRKRSA